jgi:hypothetical protein
MVDALKNKKTKMELAKSQNTFLQLGRNEVFLRYLRDCKEQAEFPYYWVDRENAIHCHCPGNPKAR